MSDKKAFKIYKILNESIDIKIKDPFELVELLINRVNRDIIVNNGKAQFKKPKKSINIKKYGGEAILYKATNSIDSMFNNFFTKEFLGESKFKKTEDMFISFFIIDKEIYFFSSGHSFIYFIPYINDDFPIKVASKLINGNIKNERSLNIMGDTLASDLIFRGLKRVSKFENLGKVVKGFKGEIDREGYIGKGKEKKKKSKQILNLVILKDKPYFCEVGNSFTFNMGLDFDQLLELIRDLNLLYLEGEKDTDYLDFQMLEKINTRISKNKKIKEELDLDVSKIIYRYYLDTSLNILDSFELVHPNHFSNFIECSSFTITYKGEKKVIDGILYLKTIIDFIKYKDGKIKSEKDLLKILQDDISLIGNNPDGITKIDPGRKDFFNYIITEFVSSDNKKYFLINGNYFFVKEDFIEILDKDLIEELKNTDLYLTDEIERLVKTWEKNGEGKYIEGEYNKEYLKEDNFIVLDKVLYDGIEFCDLLYYNDNDSYLFHNKQGFEGDMRILSEQVLISAITLSENIKLGNKKVLEDYYISLKNKVGTKSMDDIGRQSKKIKNNKFIEFFDKRNIGFVLAFTYSKDLISIFKEGDEDKFKKLSLIAKYELLTLIKKMRSIGIPFYITQIKTK